MNMASVPSVRQWLAWLVVLVGWTTIPGLWRYGSEATATRFGATAWSPTLTRPARRSSSTTSLYASTASPKSRRSHRFLTRIGLLRRGPLGGLTNRVKDGPQEELSTNNHTTDYASTKDQPVRYRIETIPDLDAYWEDEQGRFRDDKGEIDYDALIKALDVRGDTQQIGAADLPDFTHPVAQVLQRRAKEGRPTLEDYDEAGRRKSDGCRIALAIEGGGYVDLSSGTCCRRHANNCHLTFTPNTQHARLRFGGDDLRPGLLEHDLGF